MTEAKMEGGIPKSLYEPTDFKQQLLNIMAYGMENGFEAVSQRRLDELQAMGMLDVNNVPIFREV